MNVNPANFENIPAFPHNADGEHVVHAVIETPRGTRHKFAFNPKFGLFALRMTIAEGLTWPYDYGFIPQTIADDGDPLDVLFLCDEPTFTGCLTEARLLGIVRLEKNGVRNDRLIAAAKRFKGTPQSTDRYDDVGDLAPALIEGIVRFLVEYSAEQGNTIAFKGVASRKKALRALQRAARAFRKKS